MKNIIKLTSIALLAFGCYSANATVIIKGSGGRVEEKGKVTTCPTRSSSDCAIVTLTTTFDPGQPASVELVSDGSTFDGTIESVSGDPIEEDTYYGDQVVFIAE